LLIYRRHHHSHRIIVSLHYIKDNEQCKEERERGGEVETKRESMIESRLFSRRF
jgi:hypothetical protein